MLQYACSLSLKIEEGSFIHFIICLKNSPGIANPTPVLEPEVEKIAVLMPITQPLVSNRGPPLFPFRQTAEQTLEEGKKPLAS